MAASVTGFGIIVGGAGAAPAETVSAVRAAETTLTPGNLPKDFKLITSGTRDRAGVAGSVESRTWGRLTKREILERRSLGGFGPTLTLSVYRGAAPAQPGKDAFVASLGKTTVRGRSAWVATRTDGILVIGWSESGTLHAQAIGSGGVTLAQLKAFADGLVAS